MPDPTSTGPPAVFVTTRWSVVLAAQEKASPDAAGALEALCRTYWPPLYAYVRRRGHSPHDAQDLTQAFFARLLEKDYLAAARQEKGRFRSFLLAALKHFLANEWDRQHAQKRGGFRTIVSIDQELAESCLAAEPTTGEQPDVLFDRQWATTLLDRVMQRLQEEYAATGRGSLFEPLHGCIGRETSALPYGEIARQTGQTEAAVKMAVRRLRLRYRDILRQEIADTVASPEQIEDEIRHLFAAFGP